MTCNEAKFTLENTSHWTADGSERLGKPVVARNFMLIGDHVKSFSVFDNIEEPKAVADWFMGYKACTIRYAADSEKGKVYSIECKSSPLDEAISKIKQETDGRVTVKSYPDRRIEVAVECPWDLDLGKKVTNILDEYHFKIKQKLTIRRRTIKVNTPFDSQNQSQLIDQSDKDLAKKLLLSGYFATPRPKNLTQEKLAKELGMSKPTLESHLRKIETIGLTQLLGISEFTKEEMDASWDFLQSALKEKTAPAGRTTQRE